MAITTINVGTSANDNTGDTLRNAFITTNTNFSTLTNVDNTSDANKPVSTATQTALNLKANIASPTFTGTVTANSDAVINLVRVGKGAGNIGSNTVLGNNALTANTSGLNNTAVGLSALSSNLNGGYNTAVGLSALQANTSGIGNTAIGNGSSISIQVGSSNTSLGSDSLFYNISGNNNTAIGKGALQNSTSNNNTVIGTYAGSSVTTESNVTCLGYNAQVTASNQVQLGDSATTTYVYGTVQNRSDIRDKAEVRNTVLGLDFISKLRPVDYKWDMREDYKTEMPSPLSEDATEEEKDAYKIVMDEWLESVKLDNLTHDGTHTRNRYHHGLIAQEVQDLGIDFGGFQDHKINGGQDVLSIGYDELIAPMIKAIQELKAEIELLKAK